MLIHKVAAILLLVAFQEAFCQLAAANSSPLDHDKAIQEIIGSIRIKNKVAGIQDA